MNNNQNTNNASPFGMLNTNQTVPPVQNNNANGMPQNTTFFQESVPVQNDAPAQSQAKFIPISAPEPETPVQSAPVTNTNENVVTLGTVSNVTYADTIGNIDYSEPVVPNSNVGSNATERFINTDQDETSLTNLNVDGTYNNMNVAPDYVNDEKVMEILHPEQVPEKKKVTVALTQEIKMVIVIAIVLLAFIILIPYVADLFNKIRFH